MFSQAKEGVEIKGCCFRHTAATEQYMSQLIGQLLSEHNIVIGNRPTAMWRYSIDGEPMPLVSQLCVSRREELGQVI